MCEEWRTCVCCVHRKLSCVLKWRKRPRPTSPAHHPLPPSSTLNNPLLPSSQALRTLLVLPLLVRHRKMARPHRRVSVSIRLLAYSLHSFMHSMRYDLYQNDYINVKKKKLIKTKCIMCTLSGFFYCMALLCLKFDNFCFS